MNVRELKDIIKDLDDDVLVVLSEDSEGNGFSPLAEGTVGIYQEESTWNGEFSDCEDDMEDMEGKDAICLWPTN